MKIYKYLFARTQRVKIFLLNAFIKNLDDSRDLIYLRAGSNFQGGNVYGSITEPRTFGLMFGTKF